MIWNKTEATTFAYVNCFANIIRFGFVFKQNHIFIKEGNYPSEVFATDEEERNGIDIDGIRNLKDVPRLLSIDVKFGNLEVVVDG